MKVMKSVRGMEGRNKDTNEERKGGREGGRKEGHKMKK
jgi:hypothetical protein